MVCSMGKWSTCRGLPHYEDPSTHLLYCLYPRTEVRPQVRSSNLNPEIARLEAQAPSGTISPSYLLLAKKTSCCTIHLSIPTYPSYNQEPAPLLPTSPVIRDIPHASSTARKAHHRQISDIRRQPTPSQPCSQSQSQSMEASLQAIQSRRLDPQLRLSDLISTRSNHYRPAITREQTCMTTETTFSDRRERHVTFIRAPQDHHRVPRAAETPARRSQHSETSHAGERRWDGKH